ncbi:MAG: Holliday junction branch migration protein RuvA [Actinomycetota bacterium]|nr:Holliday junction branch migration protein RuvA [Actinomycetota bacterium]
MIARIKGNLISKSLAKILVEAFGIGFEIFISGKTYEKLPDTGKEISIDTYLHVREDAVTLIGFHDLEEKEIFLKLLSVSGVSVKIALSALSIYNTEEIAKLIETKQSEMLKRVPGIGKKLSDRIILELQGKFKDSISSYNISDMISSDKIEEVKEALRTLGYSGNEIMKAISKINAESVKEKSIEDILKDVLKEV